MAENASQSIKKTWASGGRERPPDPWPLVSSGFSFGTSQIQACIRPCTSTHMFTIVGSQYHSSPPPPPKKKGFGLVYIYIYTYTCIYMCVWVCVDIYIPYFLAYRTQPFFRPLKRCIDLSFVYSTHCPPPVLSAHVSSYFLKTNERNGSHLTN